MRSGVSNMTLFLVVFWYSSRSSRRVPKYEIASNAKPIEFLCQLKGKKIKVNFTNLNELKISLRKRVAKNFHKRINKVKSTEKLA